MFGKKKAPRVPFGLQALTTEALIEGTAPGDTQLYLPTGDGDWSPILLTSVRVQPLNRAAGPAYSLAQFGVIGGAVVALIHRTDVRQLEQWDSWEPYDHPLPGTFDLGPYLFRGEMLLLNEDLFQEVMPMRNVTITAKSLEANLGEIAAPFALVNTRWMSGYRPG